MPLLNQYPPTLFSHYSEHKDHRLALPVFELPIYRIIKHVYSEFVVSLELVCSFPFRRNIPLSEYTTVYLSLLQFIDVCIFYFRTMVSLNFKFQPLFFLISRHSIKYFFKYFISGHFFIISFSLLIFSLSSFISLNVLNMLNV